MKQLSFFLTTVLLIFGLSHAQSISDLPGTYNDRTWLTSEKNTLENASSSFRGLPKLTAIYAGYVNTGPNLWPPGSWGRGYQTKWSHSTWWDNDGDFYAHHPLIRDCSAFFRGHL